MRYSAEIENWICVEDYGFLSFAKRWKKKKSVSKNRHKFLDSPKKPATDAFKTVSNKAIQKLVRTKTAAKITKCAS